MNYRNFLDKARWVSAYIVTIGHALAILNSETSGSPFINFLADMRGPAVTIFFLISGYLVGGSVLRDVKVFRWQKYTIARFARIYIVLVPAILLTILTDLTISLTDPGNPVFASPWQNGALGETAIFARYMPQNIAGTLLSLEPVFGSPMGSAGSLWSLGYEWMFYFAFPVTVLLGHRVWGIKGVYLFSLGSVAACALLSRISAAFWLVWLLGAFASHVEKQGWLALAAEKWIKAAAGLFLIAYIIFGGQFDHRVGLLSAGLAGLVFLAAGRHGEARLSHGFDGALAHSSYSLYAIHLQIMALMAAILVICGILPVKGFTNPFATVLWSAAFFVVSVGVGHAFGTVFESRTHALALSLRKRFDTSIRADGGVRT